MGPAHVQVLTHHLFKEFSPLLRAIEDLGQAHLHLPDRQLPVVAGLPILRTQGQRQAVQPLEEQALDVLRTLRSQVSCSFLRSAQERKPLFSVSKTMPCFSSWRFAHSL